jgi:hypothetical protein
MALIGIEYNDHFEDVRASGTVSGAEDLTSPYYIANWFSYGLTQAGHQVAYLLTNHATEERQMRDTPAFQGDDQKYADSVDLFLMISHGNYANHECEILFDTKVDDWIGHSSKWRFGDSCNLEWLMIYGCQTIDRDNILDHHPVFQRLHLICGAYSYMYDSFTIDEAGQDTAANLVGGETVCDSWGDGVSDWFVENHPMVISVEKEWTYNNGNVLWEESVIGCDHLWGEGATLPDIPPNKQYWMGYQWWDGGIYDGW